MGEEIRLGINVDHVATLRNARGGRHPDPVRAAQLAAQAGADNITAHLREDRRHIRDDDIRRLRSEVGLPLNFEMAATAEMLSIAMEIAPHACCLVPENREERTTEGGLDVISQRDYLKDFVSKLKDKNIRPSLFIDPEIDQIDAASAVGTVAIEIHTGTYQQACDSSDPSAIKSEVELIREAASRAAELGLEVHAGHGLNFQNVQPIAAIRDIVELNIGHFLISESLFVGLDTAVKEMKRLMMDVRTGGIY
ncbi:MAG: pyridoxine 5'-phosphate synthase [Pseudomonadota bacterium]